MGRTPCCDKANVKRGPWSPEEDNTLKNYLDKHGTGGNWIALPRKAGLKRCGKSCRLRWLNYLRPNIKHGGFTEEEDNIICTLYNSIGSRQVAVIASRLTGRTDNDVKNYWNTKLKKKVLAGKIGNSNDKANNTLNSAETSLVFPVELEACYDYGNISHSTYNLYTNSSSTWPYAMDMSYQQKLEPHQGQAMIFDPTDQFPLPRLMDVSDHSASANNNCSIISSSQEVLSLSNSSSLAMDDQMNINSCNYNVSWSGNGGLEDDGVPLLDIGFESPYGFLNGFGLEEKSSEVAPYLANSMFTC